MQLAYYLMLAFLLVGCCHSQMTKVTLTDPSALCLDGSLATYYISKGSDPKTVVLYFEGGGWCGSLDLSSTLESCYQRSLTSLGSTKNDSATINPTEGIYSKNPNNHYREATRVYLRYCDGSGHQGTRALPISHKGKDLFFRGHNITAATLQDLNNKQQLFTQATTIIVTGGSAGGLAAFLWADYVRDRAAAKNVICAPDSGIFLDSPTFNTRTHAYSAQFENLFKLSNVEIGPPVTDCVKNYPTQPFKCMMAEYMVKFIKTPIFPIQSLYDSWSIPNILNIRCLKGASLANCTKQQRDYIEQYRVNTSMVLGEIIRSKENGAWGVACATHGFVHGSDYYSPNYRIPMSSPFSIDSCLSAWVGSDREIKQVYIDGEPWPANKPCSGVAGQLRDS